jgi:teichuronic acid biosynthesis glycosyltransferase TuaG
MTISQDSPPTVSIITPLFNAEPFIAETIQSVLEQTFSAWEMLVVDDCSTDNGRKIVEQIAANDSRIRLITRETNSGGPAAPRNAGMRLAQGRYIAFLDADDLWHSDKLKRQVGFMEANSNIFLLYSRIITREQNSGLEEEGHSQKPAESDYLFKQLLLSGNMVPILTVLIRNENLSSFLFDERPEMTSCEDFDFWLQLAYAKKQFALMDLPLSIYRKHDGSISQGIVNSLEKNLFLLEKWRPKITFALALKLHFLLFWRRGIVLLLQAMTPHGLWRAVQKKLGIRKTLPNKPDNSS